MQDLLKKNYEQICELILLNGGHIFVCGDVSMASDVSNTLLNFLQEFAALSQVEAQELMAQLRVRLGMVLLSSILLSVYCDSSH